jgi:hypothetical protein
MVDHEALRSNARSSGNCAGARLHVPEHERPMSLALGRTRQPNVIEVIAFGTLR